MTSSSFTQPRETSASLFETAPKVDRVLGEVVEVQGASCVCAFDQSVRESANAQDGTDNDGEILGQIGSFVKVQVNNRQVFAVVRNLRSAGAGLDMAMFAELDFVGELVTDASQPDGVVFRRGVTRFPVPGQKILTASGSDLRSIYSPGGRTHVNVGYVYPTETVKAAIDVDSVLSRHFAVLGSTGTGKSTVVSMVLRKIVEQAGNGHILIFDPHDEYSAAFPDVGIRFGSDNLMVPFWLMNLREHAEVLLGTHSLDRETEINVLKRVLVAARRKGKAPNVQAKITADSPVPYMLADFIAEIQKQMGKLEKPEKTETYLRLKSKLEEMRSDPSYGFMFSGLVVSDDFSGLVADLFRMPANGRPVSVVDLSEVPSDIVNVVVSVISRLAFDFARWSRSQGECRPMLLVCEEAHRYVPEKADAHMAVKRILDKIAKEGRKYGIGLCLVTQRPSDISESILSQCGTMLSLRLNNERDQRFVERAIPEGAAGFIDVLPSLRNRECLLVGEGIAAPSRVQIFDMDKDYMPNSENPSFVDIWAKGEAADNFVSNVIAAWRGDSKADRNG